MKDEKLISIIRLQSCSDYEIIKTVNALMEGGIYIVEITMNTPNAFHAINLLSKQFPQLTIGAGTVMDETMAIKAIDAGANFLLTPNLHEPTINIANSYNVSTIPGVFTTSEIVQASKYGIDIVKVFPISTVGSKYIIDLKGLLHHINFIPVGGVTLQNARELLEAGSFALGIGSSIVNDSLIQEGNFSEIKSRAKQFSEIVNTFSGGR
ncbi:bifunctional 4-hydroxy-2-oxoglutarate aldolase/2-dehydro-3-deoxy-phosphogluconate aldolase [Evansella sp. AB-P1]|nr:bifunctional 4-hydroxy-2-oxoglutarate aldolase/2-dehydro-3-deoxy-phosphogluconate aldolase [Evansella sp. AB-P1]MDG5787139.1 bifunctional 4-hydroxy-2-oxoglutarate aldolase/2-dehydro-3-deoxy-phosphogluconate aldolase [Evansella sp. AB-P1]